MCLLSHTESPGKKGKGRRENYSELLGLSPVLSLHGGMYGLERETNVQDVLASYHGITNVPLHTGPPPREGCHVDGIKCSWAMWMVVNRPAFGAAENVRYLKVKYPGQFIILLPFIVMKEMYRVSAEIMKVLCEKR